MSTELGGYRQYQSGACTAGTHTLKFDPIGAGHKIYLERVACEADKNNADFEFVVVSGGQEHPFAHQLNVVSNIAHALEAGVWVYPGEFVQVNCFELGDGYTIKAWLLGVDKWEKDGT